MSQEFSLIGLQSLYLQNLLCPCLHTQIQSPDTPFLRIETFIFAELLLMRTLQSMWMMFDHSLMCTGKRAFKC